MNWKKRLDTQIRIGDIVYYLVGTEKRYGRVTRIVEEDKECWCRGWTPNINNVDEGSVMETFMRLSQCKKVVK